MQPEKKYKYRITAVRQLDSIDGTSYRGDEFPAIELSRAMEERGLWVE